MKFIYLVFILISSQALATKYIKNTTGGQKTWLGNQVNAGVCFAIPSTSEYSFGSDDGVIADLSSGDGIVYQDAGCTSGFTTVNLQLEFLRGEEQRDEDGALLARSKITTTGWNYQMRNFEITTCTLGGFEEYEVDGSDAGYEVVKWYDNAEAELVQGGSETDNDFQTRLDNNCKKTLVDWTPTYDYQIIGGQMRQQNSPANDIYLFIIGVPAYAAPLGSKVFVNNLNMKFLADAESVKADGRAPKLLLYNDPAPGTNTMRFQFNNSAIGQKHSTHVSMEIFKQ